VIIEVPKELEKDFLVLLKVAMENTKVYNETNLKFFDNDKEMITFIENIIYKREV
jgi:hypothetical protein